MVRTVHLRKSEDVKESQNSVHYIPCKIHLDGTANVSQYFLPAKKEEKLEASFRGYPLKGKTVDLPKGYTGLILEERIQRSEDQERTLHVTKTFNEIVYWNWDKLPTKNDVFLAAMDWIEIAKAVLEELSAIMRQEKDESTLAMADTRCNAASVTEGEIDVEDLWECLDKKVAELHSPVDSD